MSPASAPAPAIAPAPASGPAGLAVAAAVVLLWAASLVVGLGFVDVTLAPLPLAGALGFLFVRTFLNVGLFITAHDAMHGLVWAGRPRVNAVVGAVMLRLYAGLDYERLRGAHMKHHDRPGSATDPDFHVDDPRFAPWLWAFVKGYVRWRTVGWNALLVVTFVLVGIPVENVLLFFVFPAWLSVVQLFTFGTWAPHRPRAKAFVDEHRAFSNDLPPLLSFLSCYHFGYHWEHHAFPFVPWWRLASVRAMTKEKEKALHQGGPLLVSS